MLAKMAQAAGGCLPTRQLYSQRPSMGRTAVILSVAQPPSRPPLSPAPSPAQLLLQMNPKIAELANVACSLVKNHDVKDLVLKQASSAGDLYLTVSTQNGTDSVLVWQPVDGMLQVWEFTLDGALVTQTQTQAENFGSEQVLGLYDKWKASRETIAIYYKYPRSVWTNMFVRRGDLSSKDMKQLLAYLKAASGYEDTQAIAVYACFDGPPMFSSLASAPGPADTTPLTIVAADDMLGRADYFKDTIEDAATTAVWWRVDLGRPC